MSDDFTDLCFEETEEKTDSNYFLRLTILPVQFTLS